MYAQANPFTSHAPRRLNYRQIYKDGGNKLDINGGMRIPIFTCGHCFGDVYARSVSYGLSKLFSLRDVTSSQAVDQVYEYMLDVCAERARHENCHQIYEHMIELLAVDRVSVFALSYKHRKFGGTLGRRQRLSSDEMRRMCAKLVRQAHSSGKELFCFWLDQILGQRKPKAERNWVDNGLLPYAVFETIVFPYSEQDRGAWLQTEKLLASGRSSTTVQRNGFTLITRGVNEGGPDSLMRAASALASGAIDNLRGALGDKLSIVNWALETLDMSQFMKGNQIEHFTRLFYKRCPWDRDRLSSVMLNLEILPGELTRDVGGRSTLGWAQEAELLSFLIPNDLKSLCNGSWLARGRTTVYATDKPCKFVYLQVIPRAARPRLIVVALCTGGNENPAANKVAKFMAVNFDELADRSAWQVLNHGSDFLTWRPVTTFLQECDVVPGHTIREFTGKWMSV